MYKKVQRKTVDAKLNIIPIYDEGKKREFTGVEAVCSRCNKRTESYGTGPKSVMRCLILLNKGCDKGENNFYKEGDPEMTCKHCGEVTKSNDWIGVGKTCCPACGCDSIPF